MAEERSLEGRTVAILVEQGVEQIELREPREALEKAGARTRVVAPEGGKVRAWNGSDWGDDVDVDLPLAEADPSDFDALLVPGGVMSPDRLRMNDGAVRFVRAIFDAGKPVAAICHGPWLLVEADVARGRTVTSYPSLRTDLRNAGAQWVDREVATDQGLVTSRRPSDIPAFNRKMIEEFAEGVHGGRRAA